MASASTPIHHRDSGANFQHTVCLADWWLIKAEGRRLAVAGFTSREKQAMRVFSSAPILKRYDVFTLETSDGVCVILNGFINKARTVENGFPSDVYNHFVFGFPPYWKEYDEKSIGKESPSRDISAAAEGGQPHLDKHEKDFISQGKVNAKDMQNSKTTKSSAVPLSLNSGRVIGLTEYIFNMPWIASEVLEKESYSGGPSGEDYNTLGLPLNCLKNTEKSLSDSGCRESINMSAVIDKDVNYSQNYCSGEIQSASHLYSQRRRKMATDNSRKVEADVNTATKANFDRDMRPSNEILNSNEVRVRTCPMSSLKMKEKSNQTSARISGSRNNSNFEVSGSGLPRPTDEIQLRLLDAGSIKQGFEQSPETPNQDRHMRETKTKINIQKAKNKARSLFTSAAADNEMDNIVAGKNTLYEKAEALEKVIRRKLAYFSKEIPEREKEKVPSASSQSVSFKRSRSGRLLMPTLEFWRNQRAIYNLDRTVTGIEEGIQPEQPRTG